MNANPADYMHHRDTQPGELDRIIKPLGDQVKADIKAIADHIRDCPEAGDCKAPFNRLMAELQITSASSFDALESSHRYRCELNAIDKALDASGVPHDGTLQRVNRVLKCDDVMSVTRLSNPDGWATFITDRRGHHRDSRYYIDPNLTMAGAIERARSES